MKNKVKEKQSKEKQNKIQQNKTKKPLSTDVEPSTPLMKDGGSPPGLTPAAKSSTDLPSDAFIVTVGKLKKPLSEINRLGSPCKSQYLDREL